MDNYIKYVCNKAKENGKLFVLDTGEGRSFYDKKLQIDIEDLSGWLVPKEIKGSLVSTLKNGLSTDKFKQYYCFAIWSYDSNCNLQIEFKFFNLAN